MTGIFRLRYRRGFNLIASLDYSGLPEGGVFIRLPRQWPIVIPDFIPKRKQPSLHYRNDIVRFCHPILYELRHAMAEAQKAPEAHDGVANLTCDLISSGGRLCRFHFRSDGKLSGLKHPRWKSY